MSEIDNNNNDFNQNVEIETNEVESDAIAAKQLRAQKIKDMIQNLKAENAELKDTLLATKDELSRKLEAAISQIAKAKEESEYLRQSVSSAQQSRDQEAAKARDFAISNFAKEMLEVSEIFEMALAEYKQKNSIQSLLDGIGVILKRWEQAFSRNGITPIDAEVGSEFDHEKHQAIKIVQDELMESGKIKEVLSRGYFIKDRILKPSIVVVVKNG